MSAAASNEKPNPGNLKLSSTLTQSVLDAPTRGRSAGAPTVAVSATSDTTLGGAHRVRLNSVYVTSLENAGVVPLVVPPLANDDSAFAIVSRVDGLLLTGGEDVDPSLYGQPRSEKCGKSNVARDRTEIALIHAARELGKPVLAICRGPQILNVALGGTLYQDIPSEVPGALEHNPRDERSARVHAVSVDGGSRIAEAIGATELSVNSFHHQSIRDLAPGLRITAHAPDGVIEGVESESDDWWVMAVQWHPEEMNESPEPWDRGLFKAFAGRLARE